MIAHGIPAESAVEVANDIDTSGCIFEQLVWQMIVLRLAPKMHPTSSVVEEQRPLLW